jgi:hypothetical protein
MDYLKSLLLITLVGLVLSGCNWGNKDWRTASRESARIAPDPAETGDAIIHVYGADAWVWRGWFAIHTWIALKRTDENMYTIYDVVGWRGFNGQQVMRIRRDIPDRYWYGAEPKLLKAHRGPQVEAMIDAIDAAALSYPWKNTYKAYPGPNSNTFIAWIAQQVPDLELDLPFSAIGSSYINRAEFPGEIKISGVPVSKG